MISRGRLMVKLAREQFALGLLDDSKSSIVADTESDRGSDPDKRLNTNTSLLDIDENIGPSSLPSRIISTDYLATIPANTNKNNIQTHSDLGKNPCPSDLMNNQNLKGSDISKYNERYSGSISVASRIIYADNLSTIHDDTNEDCVQTHSKDSFPLALDRMNNQTFDISITSRCNYSISDSLEKVINWLNNSNMDLTNEYYFQDFSDNMCNDHLNKSCYSAGTVEVNGKSSKFENWQSENQQLLQYGTKNSSDDPCAQNIDRIENAPLETLIADKNDGSMPYLSRDPCWATFLEESREDVCKAKENSTSDKENEVQNTLVSKPHENEDNLIYDELETMDTITDDSRDKDFDIHEYSEQESEMCSSVSLDDSMIPPAKKTKVAHFQKVLPAQSVIERIQEQKKKNYRNKQFRCKFCDEDVSSRNFVRHLERRHNHEKEVRDIMAFPLKSKERKLALEKLRNDSNFDLYLNGKIRPKKQLTEPIETEYYPCIYCKAIFSKCYLRRHVKKCIGNREINRHTKVNVVSSSQTKVACALDPTDVISKLAIRNEVLNMMRGDDISFVAKKDLLIMHYGETYLKSQRRERREYSCSNKLRELARLLLAYRSIVNDNRISFKDLLHPKNFDNVVSATRQLCGYDPNKKTYKTPSLAMHLGTTLKLISQELIHLILRGSKGFQSESKEISHEWQKNVKNFEKLVEARWNKEISSVANKDLNEKRWRKPLLVPLINDVKKFKEGALNFAKICEKQFLEENDTEQTYKLLVQCTLALLILFNRRRIGDVQYLKVEDYKSERKTDFQDFEATLSESEKVLTKQYKRVVNGGKGSRAVVILVPPVLQNFMDLLLLNREKYISSGNGYVFALPKSTLKWAQGDVAIRHLTSKINLENPQAISSNKLRKHIATAMQILSMSKNDCKQFSKFMGHNEKTHEEFYELPVDVFQTARVVKLLLMMENGIPTEFKGKTLSEIELKPDEYVEEENLNWEVKAKGNKNGRSNDEKKIDDNLPMNKIDPTSSDNNKLCVKKKEKYIREYEIESDDDLPLSAITRKLPDRNKVFVKSVKKAQNKINKGWTAEEVKMVENYFKTFLDQNTYPPGNEIKEFIKINKLQRSVPVVKSKIQHLFRLKNK